MIHVNRMFSDYAILLFVQCLGSLQNENRETEHLPNTLSEDKEIRQASLSDYGKLLSNVDEQSKARNAKVSTKLLHRLLIENLICQSSLLG